MSEYHVEKTTMVQKLKNEQVRSWVYSICGLFCLLWGLNSYSEVRPYFAIAGLILGIASMMAGNLTKKFSAKYVSVAVIIGCIMEIVAGFMF